MRNISVDSLDRHKDRDNTLRNRTLDVYKGLLIVLVVVRHVLQYSVSDEGGILTNFIWAVQMPGFMLVAGYFAARRITDLRTVGKRILLSTQHYGLPFFSWYILIDVLLLGKDGRDPITGVGNLLSHVDGGLWFLWVLFILSIIATLANYTLSSNGYESIVKTVAVFIVCFGMLLATGRIVGISFIGIKYILYYSIFYGFGWIVKWTENRWKLWWLRVESTVIFICLIVFVAMVFNFDLYHTDDGLVSIAIRVVAGFAGNAVLLAVSRKYEAGLSRIRLDWIGRYTLEIYVTHIRVVRMMKMGSEFFTAGGFLTFICSLILTVVFTVVIITAFKAIVAADFVFFGKKQNIKS